MDFSIVMHNLEMEDGIAMQIVFFTICASKNCYKMSVFRSNPLHGLTVFFRHLTFGIKG